MLVPHLLVRICHRLHRAPLSVTPEQMEELARRPWRGNVRELLNVLERAVVSTERGAPLRLPPGEPGIYVMPRSMLGPFGAAVPALEGLPVASAEPDEIRSNLEMRRRERENLSRALAHCNGRIYGPDGAAALLGMKPTTLASRVKRLHLR